MDRNWLPCRASAGAGLELHHHVLHLQAADTDRLPGAAHEAANIAVG